MPDQPMVVVRGEAIREVPPELAVFTVTVSARDRERSAALTRLTDQIAVIRELLDSRQDAIEKRETTGVEVYPKYKSGRESDYNASVSTTVKVTDFEALGELLPRLAGQELTSLSGPWWQLRRGSRAGAEVRRAAIQDALRRAWEYAAAVGAEVDRLVEIRDEGTGEGNHPIMRAMALAGGGAEAMDETRLELEPQAQTVHVAVIVRVTITDNAVLRPTD